MVLHGIAWYCIVLHGIARYCIVLHGFAWYCMVPEWEKVWSRLSSHLQPFFWLIACILTIFDKKYSIFMRRDKRESFLIVLQQNQCLGMIKSEASLFFALSYSYWISPCLSLALYGSCTIFHYLPLSSTIFHYLPLSCTIFPYLALSCFILPYLALSCFILHYLALSCTILPYLALSCTILPYLALSCSDVLLYP